MRFTVERHAANPIITPEMLPGDDGGNINGPSLIRVPDWVGDPLGRYYLYFAHHKGGYNRLAYADDLAGPWRVHRPGTLRLEQTPCRDHIASPDVHVDHARRQIRMYYHGPHAPEDVDDDLKASFPPLGHQRSRVAVSQDGLHFSDQPGVLGPSYFRVFQWRDHHYALGMPGIFYRSPDGFFPFERGPTCFSPDMRHSAVMLDGDTLIVFYSNAGDCPERILAASIDLGGDWMKWRAGPAVTVLEPETDYEGGDLPLEASRRGKIDHPVRQLRDPGIFRENGETWLIYAAAGESALALARISISHQA